MFIPLETTIVTTPSPVILVPATMVTIIVSMVPITTTVISIPVTVPFWQWSFRSDLDWNLICIICRQVIEQGRYKVNCVMSI